MTMTLATAMTIGILASQADAKTKSVPLPPVRPAHFENVTLPPWKPVIVHSVKPATFQDIWPVAVKPCESAHGECFTVPTNRREEPSKGWFWDRWDFFWTGKVRQGATY